MRRDKKISSSTKNGVFFSAATCKKRHHFWCSQKHFRPFLFCYGCSSSRYHMQLNGIRENPFTKEIISLFQIPCVIKTLKMQIYTIFQPKRHQNKIVKGEQSATEPEPNVTIIQICSCTINGSNSLTRTVHRQYRRDLE